MSDQPDPASVQPSTVRGIAGQVVANTSLLIAVLVYMGWAYDSAFYGYFHVSALSLDIGIIEYMLVSLSLFSPLLVIAFAILIFVLVARTWHLDHTKLARFPAGRAVTRVLAVPFLGRFILTGSADQSKEGRGLLIGVGVAATVTALALALIASYIHIGTYAVLGLLGGGSLLLTWPTRADRRGRLPYALAIVLAAVCALWAASLYATHLGKHAAEQVALDLSARTAVTLYTVEPIAVSGPGVQVQRLPSGSVYHYRYQGLRLLTTRSGAYYLLPVRWSLHLDATYVINPSDTIRIELY